VKRFVEPALITVTYQLADLFKNSKIVKEPNVSPIRNGFAMQP